MSWEEQGGLSYVYIYIGNSPLILNTYVYYSGMKQGHWFIG
jgi:hypothetical protein